MVNRYNVKNLTPESERCWPLPGCPAIYEITPKDMQCTAVSCPSIYDIKNKTPTEEMCLVGTCPGIEEYKDKYLIIGKKANPSDFGLEKKVGKDEVLIEVPKEIIDNKRK